MKFPVGSKVRLRNHPGRDADVVMTGEVEGTLFYWVDVHPGAVGNWEEITVVGTKYIRWPVNRFKEDELDYLDPKSKT